MRSVALDNDRISGLIVPSLLALAVAYTAYQYLAAIGPYWNISPDSATYVAVGRSLATGGGLEGAGVHPPMTSVLFALLLYLVPNGYGALNVLNTAMLLLSLFFAFLLLRRKGGVLHAMLALLLTLGSVRLFHQSTQLLSEPAYMLFSFLALLLLDKPDQAGGKGTQMLGGLAMVLAGLTRTVGVTLVLAVLVSEGVARLTRSRPVRPFVVATAILALLGIAGWEAYIIGSGGTSNFQGVFLDDPWAPSPSLISVATLRESIGDNIRAAPAVGGMLLNAFWQAQDRFEFAWQAVASLVFFAGLGLALFRRITVTALYASLYVPVVMFHSLWGGWPALTLLVPVAPLLFHYSIVAVRYVLTRASGTFRLRLGPLVLIVSAIYTGWYMERGVGEIRRRVPEEHRSPFGDYPIKRPQSFDAQRLALWIARHSLPDARFASWTPSLWEVVTERQGHDLWPVRSYPPEGFLAWLREKEVQFILIDRRFRAAGRPLETAVASYPSRFRLVLRLPDASLYEHLLELNGS